jgi:hypothetical protein
VQIKLLLKERLPQPPGFSTSHGRTHSVVTWAGGTAKTNPEHDTWLDAGSPLFIERPLSLALRPLWGAASLNSKAVCPSRLGFKVAQRSILQTFIRKTFGIRGGTTIGFCG